MGDFMRGQTFAKAGLAVLLSIALAACGGGGSIGGESGNGGNGSSGGSSSSSSGATSSSSGTTSSSSGSTGSSSGSTVSCASITLLTSSTELPSAAVAQSNGVTLTALCRDSNNNAVTGAQVTFSATTGLIEVTQGTTGAAGTATAVLTTAGVAANQTITVTASVGAASAGAIVVETGTTAQISGATDVGATQTVTYTVKLADSSGNGISNEGVTLTSALGNPITPSTSQNTNASGVAQFTYTGTKPGTDTLTATSSAVSATGTYAVTVSGTTLLFTTPATQGVSIPFNTAQQVTVEFVQNGTPVSGATVNFSASRGTLTSTAACSSTATGALSATTGFNGEATVYICSTGSQGAGGTIVSATVANGGPTATYPAQFVATTPASITIQASPSTIAPSATSTVTAVVRDANNNLVGGQLVNFTLADPTNGTLSASDGYTDATGSVAVTYQATSVTSSQGGVEISATVNGTSVTTPAPAQITVAGLALRIALGTGNTISALDATRYQMPYSVVVTDSAGNAVPNATFNLSIMSVAYQKGFWVLCASAEGKTFADCNVSSPPVWLQVLEVSPTDPDYNQYAAGAPPPYNVLFQLPFGCKTEDPQNTGIYSVALDYNGNGVLDPGAVASVPSTVALDSTGSAQFFITYPKDHANWVEVLLTGIASVAGTETTAQAEFVLPILSTDVENGGVSPPGAISPYGQASNCANPQ
jgi:hypothetical protein